MIKDSFNAFIQKVKVYKPNRKYTQITRRYVALNGFDGVTTILGVLLGNYVIGALISSM